MKKRKGKKKFSKKMWAVVDRNNFYQPDVFWTHEEAVNNFNAHSDLAEAKFKIVRVSLKEI